MFVKLNDRSYLNTDRVTKVKIAEVQDGIRIRFYDGVAQVAKSQKFESIEAAKAWIEENMK
jgi:hypothetical protein